MTAALGHRWGESEIWWEDAGRGTLRIMAAQDCRVCGLTRIRNAALSAATLKEAEGLFGRPRWTDYRRPGTEIMEAEDPGCRETIRASAAALGHLGGKRGGLARAKKLSAARRSEIARKAARARWGK